MAAIAVLNKIDRSLQQLGMHETTASCSTKLRRAVQPSPFSPNSSSSGFLLNLYRKRCKIIAYHCFVVYPLQPGSQSHSGPEETISRTLHNPPFRHAPLSLPQACWNVFLQHPSYIHFPSQLQPFLGHFFPTNSGQEMRKSLPSAEPAS